MNLHEIIHMYLRLTPEMGLFLLEGLVQNAGLDPILVSHIMATRGSNGETDIQENLVEPVKHVDDLLMRLEDYEGTDIDVRFDRIEDTLAAIFEVLVLIAGTNREEYGWPLPVREIVKDEDSKYHGGSGQS